MDNYIYNVTASDPFSTTSTIIIRYLDLALTNTNIDAFILPISLRKDVEHKQNILKINLNPHNDILPIIGDHPDVSSWKKSWRYFIASIYRHMTGIEKTEIGELWLENPKKLIQNLGKYFLISPVFKKPFDKLKRALNQLIEERTLEKHYQSSLKLEKYILKYLKENPNIKNITLISPFSAGDPTIRMLNRNKEIVEKVNEIILVSPPDHLEWKQDPDIEQNNKLVKIYEEEKPYLYKENYKNHAKINQNNFKYYKKKIVFKNIHEYDNCGKLRNVDLEKALK